jgi:hypothetical protein
MQGCPDSLGGEVRRSAMLQGFNRQLQLACGFQQIWLVASLNRNSQPHFEIGDKALKELLDPRSS